MRSIPSEWIKISLHGNSPFSAWCWTYGGESAGHEGGQSSNYTFRSEELSWVGWIQLQVYSRLCHYRRTPKSTYQEWSQVWVDRRTGQSFPITERATNRSVYPGPFQHDHKHKGYCGCQPGKTWRCFSSGGEWAEQHCVLCRSLSDVERRYSQTEKKALALVWACERFNLYLNGLPDHQAL